MNQQERNHGKDSSQWKNDEGFDVFASRRVRMPLTGDRSTEQRRRAALQLFASEDGNRKEEPCDDS
jgi:hypothetical protein